MIQLPTALQPWAEHLELFPAELQLSLGQLVRRLDQLIGPLHVNTHQLSGEPDGFDGIVRRGSYERLLLSEWVLADEVPDEFIRRAAVGEHSFFNLARRSPAGATVSVALFDAGPNQLGQPRLVHLAALIVLARRAAQARTPFQWGIFQSPETPLLTGVTEASVLTLLRARSHREITEQDLETWFSTLGISSAPEDFWLVSGPRSRQFSRLSNVSRLEVNDLVSTPNRVLVTIATRTRTIPEIELELPDDQASVRLLRDPFQVSRLPSKLVLGSQYVPASNFVFSFNHTKLFARSTQGELIAYPIPNSPRAPVGKPRLYHSKSKLTIAAVGRIKKTMWILTSTGKVISSESLRGGWDGFLDTDFAVPDWVEPFQTPVNAGPLHQIFYLTSPQAELLTLDGEGRLFSLTLQNGQGQAALHGPYVKAITQLGSKIIYIRQLQKKGWGVVSVETDQKFTHIVEGEGNQAFFGFGYGDGDSKVGLFAAHRGGQEWVVMNRTGEQIYRQPTGTTVIGIIGPIARSNRETPALVVLDDDRRTIHLLGRNWSHSLPRFAHQIDQVTLSTTHPMMAYSTVAGEVGLYSFFDEKVFTLLRGVEKSG